MAADTAVSTVLGRLVPMIENGVREEVCLLLNANKEAETLRSKLKTIHQVLMEAEQKRVVDPKVKSWLEKLQDISYDIEEVLDEWELDNLRRQHEDASESSDTIWEKVGSFLQSLCLCFKQSVKRRRIALDLKQLNERLHLIAQESEKEFNFIPSSLGPHSQDFNQITTTSSFVEVSEVKGRDDDLKKLMDFLLKKKRVDDIEIVSILGLGGMGKTTLAQLAFNRSETQFDVKTWVCVSGLSDNIEIAKAIFEVQYNSSPNLFQLETLLQRIKDSFSEKKFLLVLDDFCEENDTKWEQLKISLIQSGAPGSRILVTTRYKKVAEVFGSTQIQRLDQLSDSHCWSILSQKAFLRKSDGDRAMLTETGLKIAKKCKGLPLAAKVMGCLLEDKASLQEWQNVLGSEMWELEEMRKDFFPYLALSYNKLHSLVKRCFSYCAIFPKNFRIEVDELIRIWMSQGFLSSDGISAGDMELKGIKCFNKLATYAFFQGFKTDIINVNHVTHCSMHDIIHDFAQLLTKNECLIVKGVDRKEERVSGQKARHLNLVECNAEITMDYLHSILPVEKLWSLFCKNSHIHMDLLSHLKRVRLLSLQDCNLQEIPSEIGNLIHLRYLDLSNNGFRKLPETICDLYYLETLDLRYCIFMCELPQGIHKLVNLRHLLLFGLSVWDNAFNGLNGFEFNGGFGKLKNLRTLNYFLCIKYSNNKLGYLKDLNQLEGSVTLGIYDLSDDSDVIEAEKADLKNKISIQHLKLECYGRIGDRVMEALQPPPSLPSLDILCPQLPKWIATLSNLIILVIRCERIEVDRWHSMSSILFLEYLTVVGMSMKHLGVEFLGINKTGVAKQTVCAFPKLKKLEFERCIEWEEWEDVSEEDENSENHISILPCLEELEISGCKRLKSLPHRLLRMASSLRKLDLSLSSTLKERYGEGSGRDWDKISHIPYVRF